MSGKKHIQVSGEKEGQLVDCPAVYQCTLKGPDGEPQKHFEINRPKSEVNAELDKQTDKAEALNHAVVDLQHRIDDADEATPEELADMKAELEVLREEFEREAEYEEKLMDEQAEHDKADDAEREYAQYMTEKYSAGSAVGSGKRKSRW